jgi:glyoxylase-like metal-dependent hydrolase (beta-lactamase superfamily II)
MVCMNMPNSTHPELPTHMHFWQRGWLSGNNVLFAAPDTPAALVDSGYCSHAPLTLELVEQTLQTQPLAHLVNTHLHSDHCGGNAALQARYRALQTHIPPGESAAIRAWNEAQLSYQATGQSCPRFEVHELLQPGTHIELGGTPWHIEAAPGHDPHAVLLFEPQQRILISGDALWDNGFGVVFPDIDGERAFEAVGDTLDLIEQLQPRIVIPGHGPLILGTNAVQAALLRARSRLQQFVTSPWHHTLYGAKVLIKFKLMEQRQWPLHDLHAWAQSTPLLSKLHTQAQERGPAHGADVPAHMADWVTQLLHALERSGAAQLTAHAVLDAGSAS